MNPSRRGLLFGTGAALLTAPAIVRVAANLMPVSTAATGGPLTLKFVQDFGRAYTEELLREAIRAAWNEQPKYTIFLANNTFIETMAAHAR